MTYGISLRKGTACDRRVSFQGDRAHARMRLLRMPI
jgi:hypothetical protein